MSSGSGSEFMLKRLKREYPKAPKTVLKYKTPFEMLVATILSAQCTDARVNQVTEDLFRRYPKPIDYARANLNELEQYVKSTGFYKNKAKNIQNTAKSIVVEYDGRVPDTMEELIKLPGVARKTANIVLFNAFDKVVGIAVDTHVTRLSQRMGFSKNTDPVKIERDLMALFPKKVWGDINRVFVEHGRMVCKARNPVCTECAINDICPKKGVKKSNLL